MQFSICPFRNLCSIALRERLLFGRALQSYPASGQRGGPDLLGEDMFF